jgi:hypothetical protein
MCGGLVIVGLNYVVILIWWCRCYKRMEHIHQGGVVQEDQKSSLARLGGGEDVIRIAKQTCVLMLLHI